MKFHNSRCDFVKYSDSAIAGMATPMAGAKFGVAEAGSDIRVWDIQGGDSFRSHDDEVTLRKHGKAWKKSPADGVMSTVCFQ